MAPDPQLARLRAEARHARDRLALYRARLIAGRATTMTRLRELERRAAAGQSRLDRALRPPDDPG